MSTFSRPREKYSASDEAEFRSKVEDMLRGLYARGQSIEMSPGAYIYVRSPDGSRWQISVSDLGAIVVTPA